MLILALTKVFWALFDLPFKPWCTIPERPAQGLERFIQSYDDLGLRSVTHIHTYLLNQNAIQLGHWHWLPLAFAHQSGLFLDIPRFVFIRPCPSMDSQENRILVLNIKPFLEVYLKIPFAIILSLDCLLQLTTCGVGGGYSISLYCLVSTSPVDSSITPGLILSGYVIQLTAKKWF